MNWRILFLPHPRSRLNYLVFFPSFIRGPFVLVWQVEVVLSITSGWSALDCNSTHLLWRSWINKLYLAVLVSRHLMLVQEQVCSSLIALSIRYKYFSSTDIIDVLTSFLKIIQLSGSHFLLQILIECELLVNWLILGQSCLANPCRFSKGFLLAPAVFTISHHYVPSSSRLVSVGKTFCLLVLTSQSYL